MRSVNTFVMSA